MHLNDIPLDRVYCPHPSLIFIGQFHFVSVASLEFQKSRILWKRKLPVSILNQILKLNTFELFQTAYISIISSKLLVKTRIRSFTSSLHSIAWFSSLKLSHAYRVFRSKGLQLWNTALDLPQKAIFQ